FLQAEDGIRDDLVTGVQTCALPIFSEWNAPIDELFVLARRPSYRYRATTIGIGDGGNEIGMGTVRARLVKRGGLAARIASVVREIGSAPCRERAEARDAAATRTKGR